MKVITPKQAIIETFPAQARRLLVAVSGGVDSVVLLHLLRTAAGSRNLSLEVAHLDHRIRQESAADADFVKTLCAEWQLSCYVECCNVPVLAEQEGLSLEMAGRKARRQFLVRLAKQTAADLIVLAHHRDDQVETFLMRLLRGSGQSGLGSMRVCEGSWWRPLLNCSRQQILDYAQDHELHWVEDKSNQDPAFLRNRLRAQVLPQLLEINPQFFSRVAELTRQLQMEEDYWREQVERQFEMLVVSRTDGLRLCRTALLSQHPALRFRLLREALCRVRGHLQKIEAVHLLAVEGLLNGERSQAQLDLPGCWVARRYETLWFRVAAPAPQERYLMELPFPGELELPDGRVLRSILVNEPRGESQRVCEFAVADLPGPLRVRSWHAGDRFEPQGMSGHKRLKRFFGDNRIELEERLKTPLLVSGEVILWVVGMRRSRHAIAGSKEGEILRLELL